MRNTRVGAIMGNGTRGAISAAATILLAISTASAFAESVERETVDFSITYTTSSGESVYVLGDIPELGDNDPAYAVKLHPGSYPLWQASVAIPKGTSFTYQYTWRYDDVPQWSDPTNHNPIGSPTGSSTGPGNTRPTHKGVYYHSSWSAPIIYWRVDGGSYIATGMGAFGPGRTSGETRWRALGLGQAERRIEFYFTDGGAGRDPASGTYATLLDAFFVQDGHVFDYAPPPTISPPQQINTFNFYSTALGENRNYRVLLPRAYAENSDKTYPVLYMHDGQNCFDYGANGTWDADETAEEMTRNGEMREIIIVAADHGANRLGDYTPPGDSVLGTPGRGDDYADFLIDELKPVIDATYRTRAGRTNTATLGSSLGGNISIYLGWTYGATFGKIGPMSSALWTIPNYLDWLDDAPKVDLRTYLDSGDTGSSYDGAWDTMSLRDEFLVKGYVLEDDLRHVVGYGHQHNEAAWAARLPYAYEFLFPVTEADNPLLEEMFTGDFDGDGDVDGIDFLTFSVCYNGSLLPPQSGCQNIASDLDLDGDVDGNDFLTFSLCFNGSLNPPNCD